MSLEINTIPGRRILVGSKSYLYFGGTAYLGVQTLPEFQSILVRNIQRYGTNYGSSRLSNVQVTVYENAEREISDWAGSEACISMSSGYLAGQLLAGYFHQNSYKTFYAPNAHSSLYTERDQLYADFSSLREALRNFIRTQSDRTPVVITDSIDFQTSTYPDYDELKTLPLERCILVADDSHGIGVLGYQGQGAFEVLSRLGAKELLVCCSLGKAMGLQAGAIFATASRTDILKKTALYAGASPSSPANLVTFLEAMSLYDQQRRQLLKNVELFNKGSKQMDLFESIPGYPVYISKEKGLAEHLLKNGICITHFHYPAENSFQSRIVLSAHHTAQDIEKLYSLINEFKA